MKNCNAKPRKKASRKAPADLSESLQRRLNSYALAAGAAGVAVLACAPPAEGAPVCKTLNLQIFNTHTHAFNPADQALPPFQIAQTTFAYYTSSTLSTNPFQWWNRGFITPNSKGANLLLATNGYAANVPSGGSIGPAGKFGKGASYGLIFSYGKGSRFNKKYGHGTLKKHRGNLNFEQSSNFFGFKFSLSGQTHYGWMRVQVTVRRTRGQNKLTSIDVVDYGYESSSSTAIAAGSCTAEALTEPVTPEPRIEPVARQIANPAASPSSVASDKTRPATLGILALGAGGLQFRRKAK